MPVFLLATGYGNPFELIVLRFGSTKGGGTWEGVVKREADPRGRRAISPEETALQVNFPEEA